MSGIAVSLPFAHDGIIGANWPVAGVATYRCVPGKIEVIKGNQIKHPPTWERIIDENKGG